MFDGIRLNACTVIGRLINQRSLRILMYHRFSETSAPTFDEQCAYLVAHYTPISLSSAVEHLTSGELLPKGSVVVTIDDGYQDAATIAYPLLLRYQIPATIFVTTGFVDGSLWLWPDQVEWLFSNAPSTELRARGALADCWSGDIGQVDCSTHGRFIEVLKGMPNQVRLRVIDELQARTGIKLYTAPPLEYAPLLWEDVRRLDREGLVEFGAHTATHPILSKLSSAAEVKAEILGSKLRLESVLNHEVRHFCYPNGMARDIAPSIVREVRGANFHSAVTTQWGVNRVGSADPFLLRRIAVRSDFDGQKFQLAVSGFSRQIFSRTKPGRAGESIGATIDRNI
jgi:peptidoglycan/xylan/chitin deacetylase (PgdA/CDA1 family)